MGSNTGDEVAMSDDCLSNVNEPINRLPDSLAVIRKREENWSRRDGREKMEGEGRDRRGEGGASSFAPSPRLLILHLQLSVRLWNN